MFGGLFGGGKDKKSESGKDGNRGARSAEKNSRFYIAPVGSTKAEVYSNNTQDRSGKTEGKIETGKTKQVADFTEPLRALHAQTPPTPVIINGITVSVKKQISEIAEIPLATIADLFYLAKIIVSLDKKTSNVEKLMEVYDCLWYYVYTCRIASGLGSPVSIDSLNLAERIYSTLGTKADSTLKSRQLDIPTYVAILEENKEFLASYGFSAILNPAIANNPRKADAIYNSREYLINQYIAPKQALINSLVGLYKEFLAVYETLTVKEFCKIVISQFEIAFRESTQIKVNVITGVPLMQYPLLVNAVTNLSNDFIKSQDLAKMSKSVQASLPFMFAEKVNEQIVTEQDKLDKLDALKKR
jgi:hypothetical protein